MKTRTKSVFSCAFCVFYQHFDTKSPKTCLPDVQVVSDLGDPSRCGKAEDLESDLRFGFLELAFV